MSISLNAHTEEIYDRICASFYGTGSYLAVLDFIREAKKYIPEVEASVVDLPIVDIERCRQIANNMGVSFRVRPYYEETYVK